jgi:hypothetical protein
MAVLDRLPEPEFEQTPMCAADGCGVLEFNSDEPMDRNYSMDDLAPETLGKMIADCAQFQADNSELLAHVYYPRKDGSSNLAYAGHDFWLTRNNHGAGFWDGDLPKELGSALTKASKTFGEFNLHVGDDGKIYA